MGLKYHQDSVRMSTYWDEKKTELVTELYTDENGCIASSHVSELMLAIHQKHKIIYEVAMDLSLQSGLKMGFLHPWMLEQDAISKLQHIMHQRMIRSHRERSVEVERELKQEVRCAPFWGSFFHQLTKALFRSSKDAVLGNLGEEES